MQCPNCRSSQEDAAAECPRCGLVFAKWRAPSVYAAKPSGSPPQAAAAPERDSTLSLTLWIPLLILTAAVWAFDRWGDPEEKSHILLFSRSVSDSDRIPRGHWRFEGQVSDLLRASPIKGARISFLDFEDNRAYEDVTDDEGRYGITLPIRWKFGYALRLSHSLYRERVFNGNALSLPRAERLRMGLGSASEETVNPTCRGNRKKGPVTMDFALFPDELSESERQEADP